MVKAGSVLAPIFMAGSVAVGLFLYFRAPVLYVSFTWWMIFLGSLIRKIIDYHSGFVTFGRWGLPALLVASISIITLCRELPRVHRQGGLPFILSLLGLAYAFLIGITYGRLDLRYILTLLEWLAPLAFGFHLFMQWRAYPEYRRSISNTFVWGTAVMGAYGLYQYWMVPAWDAFYLRYLEVSSFGQATRFGLRVWGTSTSPQEFAAILLAGGIVVFSGKGLSQIVSAGAGYLGFLLTMARAGWLGWCVSFLMFLPSISLRLQIRLLISIIAISLVVTPFASSGPLGDAVNQRIESFSNGQDDTSLEARREGYNDLMDEALSQVVGQGFGAGIQSDSIGGSDTAILPLLFSFGWIGSLPFLSGIVLMLLKIFQANQLRFDAFGSASRAIALGIFSQIAFNQIFSNVFAFTLWGFLGISMAAANYYQFRGSNSLLR
ncbi:O-antigen ligase domain-containing protein [Pseudanabaena sp. FACHB-2040]|uniref:O-antigen ligase domain-containing protein n=1 Tax=Pseudanabaena sp. FACHB-2040 TaxID=2692859 RepID=UPI0016867918|nr:O-antigen ligase domain-containing protein [Pseudanabaena sp. FACHB-2040]MBD2260577.1 O-antigen ligase domain-containing protein [Pseudanabaena sp. FACHB-2040]